MLQNAYGLVLEKSTVFLRCGDGVHDDACISISHGKLVVAEPYDSRGIVAGVKLERDV